MCALVCVIIYFTKGQSIGGNGGKVAEPNEARAQHHPSEGTAREGTVSAPLSPCPEHHAKGVPEPAEGTVYSSDFVPMAKELNKSYCWGSLSPISTPDIIFNFCFDTRLTSSPLFCFRSLESKH